MPLALYALTAGAFGIGVTEFVIMGLLIEVGADLGVSIPAAGLLISGYALGVVVGAPIMTIATARWPRKTALLVLMAVFTIGNLACALAPNYWTLMAARVLTAFAHGTFFGVDLGGRRIRNKAILQSTLPSKLLLLDAADLHTIMERSPEVGRRIGAVVVERIRNLYGHRSRRSDLFARAVEADRGDDPVTGLQIGYAGANALDDACDLGRRREGKWRLGLVLALHHQDVEEVQRRRLDGNDDFAGTSDRIGQVAIDEIGGFTPLRADYRFHGHHLRRSNGIVA